jgi:hypothetical protein
MMAMMAGSGAGEVRDPLTGEMRKTPSAVENKQPQWWSDMLEFGGAVIWVEVRPAKSNASSGAGGSVGKGSLRRKSKGKSEVVMVNKTEVVVVKEAEALSDLGREELMDDRVSKMSVISRCVKYVACRSAVIPRFALFTIGSQQTLFFFFIYL